MTASHEAQPRRWRSPTPTPIQTRPNTSTIAPITPAAKPNARGSPTPTRISGATMNSSPRPTIRTPRSIVSTAGSVTQIGRDGGGEGAGGGQPGGTGGAGGVGEGPRRPGENWSSTRGSERTNRQPRLPGGQ